MRRGVLEGPFEAPGYAPPDRQKSLGQSAMARNHGDRAYRAVILLMSLAIAAMLLGCACATSPRLGTAHCALVLRKSITRHAANAAGRWLGDLVMAARNSTHDFAH